jgi:hypothetical protein
MRGLRVYAGYSGWGAGQLQNELARGDWHVMPADAATVFDKDPALIWPDLIRRATTKQTRRDEGGGLRDEESSPRTAGDTHHSSLITHHALSTSGASR